MPKKAKRRFVGLDTEEVSLVDTPANEVEFLVTKNQEDEDMGAQAAQTTNDDAVRVPVEVEGGEAVAKALEHVNGIVDKISTMVQASKAGEPADDADATDDTEATDDGDTVDTEKATLKGVLAAMGMSGDDMKKAMDKLKKAGFDPNMKFPSAKAPVSKAAVDDADADEAIVDEDDQPLTFATLQKAARFTPSRISKIQEAVDALKLVLEAIAPNMSPGTRTPGVESHSNPNTTRRALAGQDKKPVMKSADGGELAEVLKSLGTAVGKLDERLASIEKTRTPTNSVEDDADASDSDAVTTEKSIWSGLL